MSQLKEEIKEINSKVMMMIITIIAFCQLVFKIYNQQPLLSLIFNIQTAFRNKKIQKSYYIYISHIKHFHPRLINRCIFRCKRCLYYHIPAQYFSVDHLVFLCGLDNILPRVGRVWHHKSKVKIPLLDLLIIE